MLQSSPSRGWARSLRMGLWTSVLLGHFACLHQGNRSPEEARPEISNSGHESPEDDSKEGAHPKEKSTFFGIFAGPPPEKSKITDEDDLKIAKLWSRVEQLSVDVHRLRERLRVLEKGLTLGLIPEELKQEASGPQNIVEIPRTDVDVGSKAKSTKEASVPEMVAVESAHHAALGEQPGAHVRKAESDKDYQGALAVAHDHFRAGRYGRAIVEYDAIGKRFGDLPNAGSYRYWVALCWIHMKEYTTARQLLVEFLKDQPQSAWAPRATLELARVEWKLGLGETALSRFRDLIRDHPQEDAAEMAKMEIANLDKTL